MGTYDPRTKVAHRLALKGEFYAAKSLAGDIARDNKAAGYVAYEVVAADALNSGDTFWAKRAAEEAARLLR